MPALNQHQEYPDEFFRQDDLYNPPQAVGLEFGFMMVLVSIMGLFNSSFLGLNLSFMHCLVFGFTGLFSVLGSYSRSSKTSFQVDLGLGFFFLANALLAYFLDLGTKPSTAEQLNRYAPGFLELGVMDHIVHLCLSIVFFSEALSLRNQSFKETFFHQKIFKFLLRIVLVALFVVAILAVVYQLRGLHQS